MALVMMTSGYATNRPIPKHRAPATSITNSINNIPNIPNHLLLVTRRLVLRAVRVSTSVSTINVMTNIYETPRYMLIRTKGKNPVIYQSVYPREDNSPVKMLAIAN